jgi:hypothetical protein
MNAEPLAFDDARGTRIPTPRARIPVDGAVDPAAAPEFPKPTTDTPSAVESLF